MEEEIIAYKAFKQGLINRYGTKFEPKKRYKITGKVKWGNTGNGFHMCTYPEDCFRYVDSQEAVLTLVKGFGEKTKINDEYYGYYDMYVCEGMEIQKILTREEIIQIGLNLYSYRATKFLKTFKLTKQEIEIFKEVYKQDISIIDCISYYQEGDKKAYIKRKERFHG